MRRAVSKLSEAAFKQSRFSASGRVICTHSNYNNHQHGSSHAVLPLATVMALSAAASSTQCQEGVADEYTESTKPAAVATETAKESASSKESEHDKTTDPSSSPSSASIVQSSRDPAIDAVHQKLQERLRAIQNKDRIREGVKAKLLAISGDVDQDALVMYMEEKTQQFQQGVQSSQRTLQTVKDYVVRLERDSALDSTSSEQLHQLLDLIEKADELLQTEFMLLMHSYEEQAVGLLHQEMLSLATMEFSQSLTGEQSELKAQLASKEQEVLMLTERLEQYEASEQHRELLASTQAEIAMHDTNFDDVLSQLSEQKHSIQQHLDQAQQELRSQLADARDREQSSSSVPSSSAEGEGEAGQSVLALQLRMQASSSSAASDANNGADTQVNEGEDAHTRTRTRTHAPNQALTQKLSDVLDTVSLLEKALMVRVHSHMEERADYEQALLEQQLAMTQQREVFESRMREQQNEYEEELNAAVLEVARREEERLSRKYLEILEEEQEEHKQTVHVLEEQLTKLRVLVVKSAEALKYWEQIRHPYTERALSLSLRLLTMDNVLEVSQPFTDLWRQLRIACAEDPVVLAALASVPARTVARGVPTVTYLQDTFKPVEYSCRKAMFLSRDGQHGNHRNDSHTANSNHNCTSNSSRKNSNNQPTPSSSSSSSSPSLPPHPDSPSASYSGIVINAIKNSGRHALAGVFARMSLRETCPPNTPGADDHHYLARANYYLAEGKIGEAIQQLQCMSPEALEPCLLWIKHAKNRVLLDQALSVIKTRTVALTKVALDNDDGADNKNGDDRGEGQSSLFK